MNVLRGGFSVSCALLLVILLFEACKEDSSPTSNVPVVPPFTDPIPFSVVGSGKLAFYRVGPPGNSYAEVFIVEADRKVVRGLGNPSVWQPSISPDGMRIAGKIASADYNLSYDIAVLNIDGTGLMDISNLPGVEAYPSWNHNGSMLLYWTSKDLPSLSLVWQSPVPNPTNLQTILQRGIGSGRISISHVGVLLYLSRSTYGSDMYARDVVTSSDVKLRTDSTQYPGKEVLISAPTWSPDGQTIAYLEELRDSTTGGQFTFASVTVKVMDKDGKNGRTVIVAQASGIAPAADFQSLAWSPDGTKIAFTKPDGLFEAHIYMVNVDGTGFTAITTTKGVTDCWVSWSRQ